MKMKVLTCRPALQPVVFQALQQPRRTERGERGRGGEGGKEGGASTLPDRNQPTGLKTILELQLCQLLKTGSGSMNVPSWAGGNPSQCSSSSAG